MASQTSLDGLHSFLDSLDLAPRAVFLLHRVDALAFDQIAWRLGLTVAEVEQHLAQAVYQLGGRVESG